MTVKTKHRGVPIVVVTLGEAERHLRLDFNAMALLEEHLGINLLSGDFDWTQLTIRQVRAFVWACLQHGDDPRPTLEEVGGWMHPNNMLEIAQAIGWLWSEGQPEPDQEAASPLVHRSKAERRAARTGG